jgi:hypothetical protein
MIERSAPVPPLTGTGADAVSATAVSATANIRSI